MKILGDRRTLLDAVGIVSSAVATKTTKPILGNILLTATDDCLTLYATDQEIAVRSQVAQVKVEQPGECLVPARELAAILRELTDPTVTLNADTRQCKVEGQSGTFSLAGADVTQYPAGFQASSATGHKVAAASFVDLVRRTSFATAKEATRFAMNGVLCEVRDGRLQMVGTDGRRMALAWRSLAAGGPRARAQEEAPQPGVIVPVRGLQAVVTALPLTPVPLTPVPLSPAPVKEAPAKEGKKGKAKDVQPPAEGAEGPAPVVVEQVEVLFGTNQILFRFGTTEVFARLIDGEFPQYDLVVPKSSETTVDIERTRFESLVRMAAIFRESELRAVRMTLGGGTLRLDSELANVGSASVNMEVDMRGPGGQALFNPDYILEFLRVTPAQTLRLEFSDENSPGKFVPEEEFIYIVMPITGA